MHSFNDLTAIIEEVECEPFVFRLDCIECVRTDVPLVLRCTFSQHTWFVQAMLWRKDTENGDEGWGHGAKYFLSPHMTQGEVVKKCFVAARDYAEHEVREAFKWRGRRILGPHIDIEALWDIAERYEVRS